MPDPIGTAVSTSSRRARSLHKARDVETALWAVRRAPRDMSGHFTAASTLVPTSILPWLRSPAERNDAWLCRLASGAGRGRPRSVCDDRPEHLPDRTLRVDRRRNGRRHRRPPFRELGQLSRPGRGGGSPWSRAVVRVRCGSRPGPANCAQRRRGRRSRRIFRRRSGARQVCVSRYAVTPQGRIPRRNVDARQPRHPSGIPARPLSATASRKRDTEEGGHGNCRGNPRVRLAPGSSFHVRCRRCCTGTALPPASAFRCCTGTPLTTHTERQGAA